MGLAKMYESGSGFGKVRKDQAKAKGLRSRIEASCDQGDADSCELMAEYDKSGPAAENRWHIKSLVFTNQRCGRGEAKACFLAGKAHLLGRGTPMDRSRAAELLGKACALRSGDACDELASINRDKPALQWGNLVSGCELGHAHSCARLRALFDSDPPGDAAATKKGEALLKRRCLAGTKEACASKTP